MPNNILEVLLRGLGQGVSAYPGAMQEQTQFQRSNLREMLGMQERQKEQSATEMYRQQMHEMQKRQIELAENKAMFDIKQSLMERFIPPQPKPMHPLDEEKTRADIDYTRRQTELLGTPKPGSEKMPPNLAVESRDTARKEQGNPADVFKRDYAPMMSSYQSQYPTAFGPNAADSIMALLRGPHIPSPADKTALSPLWGGQSMGQGFVNQQPKQMPQPSKSYDEMNDDELQRYYLERFGR